MQTCFICFILPTPKPIFTTHGHRPPPTKQYYIKINYKLSARIRTDPLVLLFLLYEKGNVTISHASLHMSLHHAPYLELKGSMLSCLLASLENWHVWLLNFTKMFLLPYEILFSISLLSMLLTA